MPTTPVQQLPYPAGADPADGPLGFKNLAEAVEAKAFIVGEMRPMALLTPPRGWLACDFLEYSRTTYQKLWDAIRGGHAGTAGDPAPHGNGNGTTTFNVPDARGRALVGAGQGTGLTARSIGTKWGVEAVVLTVAQMPAHSHGGFTDSMDRNTTHYHSYRGQQYSPPGADNATYMQPGTTFDASWQATDPADINHYHRIWPDGGGSGHDNIQPSLAIPVFIYAGYA